MAVANDAAIVDLAVFDNTNPRTRDTYPFVINFYAEYDVIQSLVQSKSYKAMCGKDEIIFNSQGDNLLAVFAKDESIIKYLQRELHLQYVAAGYQEGIKKINEKQAELGR